MIRKEPYGLVILDLKIPQVSGHEVLYSIKKLSPYTKVLLITGAMLEENVSGVLSTEADVLFYKPFNIGELVEKVKYILVYNDSVTWR